MKIHLRSLVVPGLLLFGSPTLPVLAAPSGSHAFYCTPFQIQQFTVPAGVTSVTATLIGAHGGNPGKGAPGGFGGYVQGNLQVTPGQILYIFVGCINEPNAISWGYGSGGVPGTAPTAAGNGGFGGGGSAVTQDAQGNVPLIVAGGGGGGGGDNTPSAPGGLGGNAPAEFGQDGFNAELGFGTGGTGGGQPTFAGGPGGGGGDVQGGGGGGGGGGYLGGAGGLAGDQLQPDGGNVPGGGGGGGAGSSYFASATQVNSGTGQLGQNGFVSISWPAAQSDADADGIPDSVDACPGSNKKRTVVFGKCDSHVANGLDTDGCTINDRISKLAASTTDPHEFVDKVRGLIKRLQRQGFLTTRETRALREALSCSLKKDHE